MMKKTEDTTKKKGMYLVATFGAVMLIALSALAVGMLRPKENKPPEKIDLNSTPTPGLPTPTVTASLEGDNKPVTVPTTAPTVPPVGGKPAGTGQETPEKDNKPQGPTGQPTPSGQGGLQVGGTQEPDEGDTPVNNPDGVIKGLNFSAETGMMWPITGDALIAFSPDHAIYHKTLDSYRTSNYVLLGGEVGAHVSAAADGVVTAVSEELKTGTTVTMQVSADHEIVYGMLSNVTVKEGDFVNAGTVFATVAEPTRYFLEDGSGLYLQVLENDVAVNPMLYLR